MALQGFVFGGDTGETPESIKRKRELIARLTAGSRAPRNVGEGFNALGDGLAAAVMEYRTKAAEREAMAKGDALVERNFNAQTASPGNPVVTSSATGSRATGPATVAAPADLAPLFSQKEAAYNLPAGYLARTAQIESNFNPNAKNPNSSATGLFQFINSTARQYGLDNPRDPAAATAAAARLAADNKAYLSRVLGRDPTAGELYLAHQQGAGGAAKLLANPNAPVDSIVGSQAARLNGGQPGMTANAFAQRWTGKFGNMPVVSPGDGAAQMPLARQQVQTAPMPNAGLADMPAPGASPSAVEAAPPMVPGGGVAVANNEDDTQFLEARMAAAQGQPMPAPAPEPVPVNADNVFSPIPMGAAPNPFVQRAPFEAPPQADMQAPASQDAALVNAPMPPRRPADLAPVQQPIQQQAQPSPVEQMTYAQQGAANAMDDRMSAQAFASGGMGQAGPRRSILDGLMSGNNSPFVPAALREPQPGVMPQQQAQATPDQTAAQTTPQSRQANLAALLNSPFVAAETKQLALNQYKEEQARAQAEAERVRTEQQSAAAAKAAGLDPALLGNPIIGQQAAAAKFREAPEQFRDLTPEERTQRGIDPNDKRPYQVSTKTGKLAGVGGQQIINNIGGGSDKQFFDTVKESADAARTASTGLNALREARKAVEDGGFFGAGADARLGFAKLGSALGFEDGRITNTETFRSAIAPQVAAVMKATVGSTQISNADREFAEKAAGGSINLDDKSIKRLLDIMERGSNDIITRHQKQLDAVYPESPDGKFARERAVFGVQVPTPREPQRDGPARPASKADYDALPSGSTFIAPDGTTRRKP